MIPEIAPQLAIKKKPGPVKHRHTSTLGQSQFYMVWAGMVQRCTNPNNKAFKWYGGKSNPVTVCEGWRDFSNFLRDMGPNYTPGLTLDRKNTNLGYSKENCRWVSWDEQRANRSDSHFFEFDGRKMTVAQWAKELGMNYNTLFYRVARGWTVEKAITTPVK